MKQEALEGLSNGFAVLTVSLGAVLNIDKLIDFIASLFGGAWSWVGDNATTIGAFCAIFTMLLHSIVTWIASRNRQKSSENSDKIEELNKKVAELEGQQGKE